MGTLTITEFQGVHDSAPGLPAIDSNNLTTNNATSVQSAALDVGTQFVRLRADEAMYIAIGTAPTAVAGNLVLDANNPEYFHIKGGTYKVAGLDVA